MSWQELELSVEATGLAEVEALLKLAGAEAVSLLDAANTEILEPEPGETPLWSIVTLLALFSSETPETVSIMPVITERSMFLIALCFISTGPNRILTPPRY